MAYSASSTGLFNRTSSGNVPAMRGLVSFIADLRNARARDLEEKRINKELANIRQKFKDGGLNGYQKKKYVCKLLYIYILGWNVDFGHLEAVYLISATKYSQKQIGYLAVTLFLHEEHELLHLVVNSVRKDLMNSNELNNCLALHAIANVGGREMCESLCRDVLRLLFSPTSKAFVKKKAALAMLRVYRKCPYAFQHEWSERIISFMDDSDWGVVLSVTSLIQALARDRPDVYKSAYVKAVRRLKSIVVDAECPLDYLYYSVPCPWLQIKLLKLLQIYPASEDSHVRELLRQSLLRILDSATSPPKNAQHSNSLYAVLFEAINLIICLDTEKDLLANVSLRLGSFIQSRDTNIRYLGLESMTHLAAKAETLDPIKRHQAIIIGSLRDRDISVRRQGLNLLFSMCDRWNAQLIVSELLKYLQTADYAIREEMVLKIAVLAEKYALDAPWYINISLRLIATAGDHVADEVWQRVVHIVTNHDEELQVYAVRTILDYMRSPTCHEKIVKIGAYLLGEFGRLIAHSQDSPPSYIFSLLHGKLTSSSSSTKAILLSCFIKFVNTFPELKEQILGVFRAYCHSLDAELQQRACEYYTLASFDSDDLLQKVCQEMPPFPERASALLARLNEKQTSSTIDKRAWMDTRGENEAILDITDSSLALGNNSQVTVGINENEGGSGCEIFSGDSKVGSGMPTTSAGLENKGKNCGNIVGTTSTSTSSGIHLSPNWEQGYSRLLLRAEGVLYEDAQLQISVQSEYRGQLGCLIIVFTNRSKFALGSFTTTIDIPCVGGLKADVQSLPDTNLGPNQNTQQIVMFEALNVFSESPTIRISYLAGSLQALTLRLPVALHKYMEAAELSSNDFFQRWKQIGGSSARETQEIFGLISKDKQISPAFSRSVVQGFRWGVLSGLDPHPDNIVGASVLHTSEGGRFGCLLRLEPNYTTRMYRLTVRSTGESVPPVLVRCMKARLTQGENSGDRLSGGGQINS